MALRTIVPVSYTHLRDRCAAGRHGCFRELPQGRRCERGRSARFPELNREVNDFGKKTDYDYRGRPARRASVSDRYAHDDGRDASHPACDG